MKQITIFFIVLILLTGCGRSAFFGFTSSTVYNDALMHTKRTEITDKFESRVLMSATYLNGVYPDKYSGNEFFLIGLYISNDFRDEKAGINNPNYTITLNKEPFIKVDELDKEDPLLKQLPLINRWSRYYIAEFNQTATTQMALNIHEHDTNQSKSVTFTK